MCFLKLLPLRSEKLLSGSESEVVQSLSEFRVFVQRINVKKKEHKQLYMFLPQTRSSPVPLALPRRVSLKCNIKLQVAQTQSKRLHNAQGQLQETSFAQSQLKETYMLNHKRKRLLCSITKERVFLSRHFLGIKAIWLAFDSLIYFTTEHLIF